MAEPDDTRNTQGAPPTHVHVEKKKDFNWLPWLLLGLGVLALLIALARCDRNDAAPVVTNDTVAANEVVAATPNAPEATALVGTSGMGTYLAGTEAAPRTFTFEKLNFDSAKSDVRAADRAEIDQVAGVLQQYGTTDIRIAGYADARGPDAANIALGKARAEAVKSALVAKGIAATRIETVSGGESDPVDTNATSSGQAENRRTEVIVTKR